jgi:UDP-N-acetylmuramate dehydrogenase
MRVPTAGAEELVREVATVPGLALTRDEALAGHTTLRIGGPAEIWARVASEDALAALMRTVRSRETPFAVLGLGSNVLVPDEGLAGVVARLGGELDAVRVDGTRVEVGAALPLAQLARRMAAQGLVGLEALSGFPSTVGGAVVMNAGCYGTEIADVLESCQVVTPEGRTRRLDVDELAPSYRETSLLGSGCIVTRAVLRLAVGDAGAAVRRIDDLNRKRWSSLPSGLPNAGSIFKNPPGDHAGRLIEACGLKGRVEGRAQISPKHANVIVNLGGARAVEVLALMTAARDAVAARFGVELEPELVLTGSLPALWREAVGARL